MKYKGVIYKYTSPSGKIYIGQTTNERQRYCTHKSKSIHPDNYFHQAIHKYGIENFKYEVLFRTQSDDMGRLRTILNAEEKYYIRKYNSNDRTKGYNLTEGGEGIFHASLEVRQKISASKLGHIVTEETRRKISNTLKGHKLSQATKDKHCKTVYQYDKNYNLVHIWNSSLEYTKYGYSQACVSACCRGERKTHKRYFWSYKPINK